MKPAIIIRILLLAGMCFFKKDTLGQCNLSLSLQDTILLCNGSNINLNPVITGTNIISKILWSPSSGLSDTSILNPVATIGTSAVKYYLNIKSLIPANLITNPGFSSGNTGFSTAYTYKTTGPVNQKEYWVATNPQAINPLWPSSGDHTTGTGLMFIADAATAANTSCWCQVVTVKPNTYYKLSGWAALMYLPQAILKFEINGSTVGNLFTTSSSLGVWNKYEGEWYSGASTSASICIYDTNLTGYGNDFALDDLALQEICFTNDSIVINPVLVSAHITGNTVICDGDSLHLQATANPSASGYSWLWPGGTSTQQNLDLANPPAGKYLVSATVGGCAGKDSVNVQVIKLNVDLGKDQNLCNAALPVLSPNILGATYLWQDGSTADKFSVPGSGKYYVTVTVNGCSRSDTITIKALFVNVDVGTDTSLCLGDTLILSAPNGFDKYAWSTGATGKSIIIKEPGKYWVRVLKEYCDAFDTVDVTYLDGRFYLPEDTVLCNGQVYELEATSIHGSKYEWKDGSRGNKYTISQAGFYWVNATNQCGSFGDTIWVEYEECDCRPFVPTAFTPNGDGRNDAIHPYLHCPAKEYKFMIVNRWGQVVFESKNPNNRWDGNFKNTPAEAGTYFYYLEVKGPDGRTYNIKGNITLVH